MGYDCDNIHLQYACGKVKQQEKERKTGALLCVCACILISISTTNLGMLQFVLGGNSMWGISWVTYVNRTDKEEGAWFG